MDKIQKGYILTAKASNNMTYYFWSSATQGETMVPNGFSDSKIFPSVFAARSNIAEMSRRYKGLTHWKAQFIS